MITEVTIKDSTEITTIYNHYIRESVATFDTEEWSVGFLLCTSMERKRCL